MVSQLRELNLRLVGIARVLQGRPLRVPLYQRSYSWRPKQVEAFWRDLQAAMLANVTDYFMGTIVLSSEEHEGDAQSGSGRRVTVVDGQQRLATVSLLLSCMRDFLRQAGEEGRASSIETTYLSMSDLRSGESVPRLFLNTEDADFFASSIIGSSAPSNPVDFQFLSNRRLSEAREQLNSFLAAEMTAAGPNWMPRLFDWIEFLQDRVRVISIEVETEADAFLIFETLNDRGLGLTIADLLKNHLLSIASSGPGAPAVHAAWMQMLSAFPADRDDEDNDLVTSFIRHYWSSLHGPTRERELYQSLKRRILGASQAASLVHNLSESAPSYAALLDPEHYRWQELNIARALSDSVLRFGLEQPRPLLLAAMDNFEEAELAALLKATISWATRGLIVGGIGGGTSERYYSRAAEAVRRRRATTMAEVADIMDMAVPADAEFAEAFKVRRVNNPRLAKYYIAATQRAIEGRRDPALISDAELQTVRLVHVMPRQPTADSWDFPPDSIRQWSLRLGNQVVIEDDLQVIRVDNFVQRKEQLTGSGQYWAQKIVASPSWTSRNIEDVQELMALEAVAVWPHYCD